MKTNNEINAAIRTLREALKDGGWVVYSGYLDGEAFCFSQGETAKGVADSMVGLAYLSDKTLKNVGFCSENSDHQ